MTAPRRIVIIGGGFGGLYAAKSLRRAPVQITLIDRRNFHLFQPLLYQVATGGLSPGDIALPLRAALRRQKNTRVLLGEAVDFDVEGRRVILADGESGYDILVVAPGARNHYFENHHWERVAPGLKSIEDATEIRRRILFAFEAAERETNPEKRRAWLTFIVVGGGPTGVELAGALGEITRNTLKGDFRAVRPEEASILLLDGSERVLPPFDEDLSEAAERSLIKLGVRTRDKTHVVEVDEQGVTVKSPSGRERIPARTVLWAAGVRASELGEVLAKRTGAETDRSGRIVVQPDLTLPGHPEIFVIGDLANCCDLPGLAPVAMQQGRYVAQVIQGKAAGPFRYRDKGHLATVGRAAAVAQFGKLHFSGYLAWIIWLVVHILYLAGFQNRVLVLVQWAFHYFTFNRGARLITQR